MLGVVKRLLIAGKNDAAALQQQIAALRAEGRDASLAIDQLKVERAAADSYDQAIALDDKIARQEWIVDHCAAKIPRVELELAAAKAAAQAAALAKHKAILIGLYPRLKAAILAAVEAQAAVIAARDAAIAEIGEALAVRNLPTIAFAGFLAKDLVEIWSRENDRVVFDLARQPKPAALPVPVRAALPAPAKPKPVAALASPAAPRPRRVARHDPFPTDGQQALVVFLRAGVELPDGSVTGIGDEIALPAEQARQLILKGAADYVPAAETVTEETSRG
jgi:hypothetical protein